MIKEKVRIVSNNRLSDGVYELVLDGASKVDCGQFIELTIPGFYLNRPFSVADYENGKLTVLYKILGEGTLAMTALKEGTYLDMINGLGNGFLVDRAEKPLLVGGGIGIAPLYYLAKELVKRGKTPTIVLGYRTKNEVFYLKEFEKLGVTMVATDDGTLGLKGNVLTVIKASEIDFDYYYACGPMVMLNALKAYSTKGEISLEARMGCGFGACMGCSIMTTSGTKRVCKEGPVFDAGEVI